MPALCPKEGEGSLGMGGRQKNVGMSARREGSDEGKSADMPRCRRRLSAICTAATFAVAGDAAATNVV